MTLSFTSDLEIKHPKCCIVIYIFFMKYVDSPWLWSTAYLAYCPFLNPAFGLRQVVCDLCFSGSIKV